MVLIAIARRATTEAPEDTGEFQAMGVIGVAQPGVLQAESWLEEEESRVSSEAAEEPSTV